MYEKCYLLRLEGFLVDCPPDNPEIVKSLIEGNKWSVGDLNSWIGRLYRKPNEIENMEKAVETTEKLEHEIDNAKREVRRRIKKILSTYRVRGWILRATLNDLSKHFLYTSVGLLEADFKNASIQVLDTQPEIGPISGGEFGGPPARPTDVPEEILNPEEWSAIHDRLDAVGVHDIYGLLLDQASNEKEVPTEELLTLIDNYVAKNGNIAITLAQREACAKVKVIFKREHGRESYNYSLILESKHAYKLFFEVFSRWRQGNYISPELWSRSISELENLGFPTNEAEWLVHQVYCGWFKCKQPPPDVSEPLGRAIQFLAQSKYADVIKACDEVLARWKNHPEATKYKEQAKNGLEAERKAAAQMLDAAKREIQVALNAKEFPVARSKVAETDKKNLPGFEADKWLIKIKRAEIAALQFDYDSAWKAAEWEKAKRIGKALADLGENTVEYWNKDVDRHRRSYKQDLETAINTNLSVVSSALNQMHIAEAVEALKKAKDAQEIYKKAFEGGTFLQKIRDAEKALADKKRELLIEGLRKVEALTAKGSTDGPPVITVSWKPASGGTPAAKWKLLRRMKGAFGNGKPLGDFDTTSFTDNSADLKLGVEYVYEVTPLAKTGENKFEQNANAVAQSSPAVCLAKLASDALKVRGEGDVGTWGLAKLSWVLPDGLDDNEKTVRLKLSRSDGRIKEEDVTGRREYWDENVEVGQRYEYTLTLCIAEQVTGESTGRVVIEQARPLENVQNLNAKRMTSGRWLVTWNWPEGVDRVLVVISGPDMVVPDEAWDTPDAITVTKEYYESRLGWEVYLMPGKTKITVFSYKETGGQRRRYSTGKSYPDSSSSGMKVERILCEIVPHPKKFFKAAMDTEINVRTEEGGALPPLLVVAGNNGMPVRCEEGRTVATIPASPCGSISITVSSAIDPQTIAIFYANPKVDAERFRLAAAKIK